MNEIVTIGAAILVAAVMTGLTRAMPYLIFGRQKEMPKVVSYLGSILPPAIMVIIIVYCIRNVEFTAFPYGLAELLSIVVVVLIHLWKKNTFLTILVGTACYMILIRTVFPL